MDYNVQLAVRDGVGLRRVQYWIDQWVDAVPTRWGEPSPDDGLPDIWWVPVEFESRDHREQVTREIVNTIDNDPDLLDYGIHDRDDGF